MQQDGRIRLVRNGVVQATDFLNIAVGDRVLAASRDCSAMALSPDYATSGRFFVNLHDANGDTSSRGSGGTPRTRSPRITHRFDLLWSTGERFIRQPFEQNHNGGNLAFGPDGYPLHRHG